MTFPESVCSLWYYPSINRFTDEDGNILHDLSDRFDVWQLDEWKKDKEYGILLDHKGQLCELYYPEGSVDENLVLYSDYLNPNEKNYILKGEQSCVML